jgi:uridine phosphorylase
VPIHLQPTAELAERVLLPGDPGRALLLAQTLIDGPKMFNHHRGLWGYSGAALADGRPLTIQATGMGGPSAAIVIAELADLGARTLLRVGTCAAIAPGPRIGDLFAVTEALCGDGTSRALGAGERVRPSAALTDALRAAGGESIRPGVAVSSDLFYDAPDGAEAAWARAGAEVVEMEAATLFALGARRGLTTAAVLIVSDLVVPHRERISEPDLRDAERRMGEVAVAALAATGRPA